MEQVPLKVELSTSHSFTTGAIGISWLLKVNLYAIYEIVFQKYIFTSYIFVGMKMAQAAVMDA